MKEKNEEINNKRSEEEKITFADHVRNFFKELVPYVIIIFVVAIIRLFIITPVKVNGASMYPYLKDGEILILNKLNKDYKRFDIVVAKAANTKIIKRIIGLPGENIEYKDCKLYIDGKEYKDFVSECITNDFTLEELYDYAVIPEGYYFVMGDNRKESSDSRDYRIGLIKKDQIDGKTSFRLIPFNRFGKLKK